MKKRIKTILATSVLMFVFTSVTSCSTDISYYKNTDPTFSIKEYFNGRLVAWGMVQDYSNQITRRFCVEIDGSWKKNQGVLAEKFYFNDGEVSYRTWNLIDFGEGRFEGTAEDVIGVAKGQESGFAFQWQYQLSVPIDGSVYQFTMDDWMYQIDKGKVFNRTSMSKLGIKLAEITLLFDKSNPNGTCELKTL